MSANLHRSHRPPKNGVKTPKNFNFLTEKKSTPIAVAEQISAFLIRHKFAKPQPGYQARPSVPGMGGLGRMGRF